MAKTITIDPVTRLEGHLKINVDVEADSVINAWATGTLFRGFETILVNRPPEDAQHITQRICGVCPVPHGLAAVMALDRAYRVTPPGNARIMRNLVLGANFIQSHILHFYHLSLPDFIDGPNMPPWQPSWGTDKRFTSPETATLVEHYVTALEMTRKAHEMGALFGGRMPHPPTYVAGGFTTTPRKERIAKFQSYLKNDLVPFVQNIYLEDANLLAEKYQDYFEIGKGPGNLLSFGVFDQDAAGNIKLLRRGRAVNGSTTVQPVDVDKITEQVSYSWYADNTNDLKPTSGATQPQYPKGQAYSWSKAPRYGGVPYEAGPLARMWVNGDYTDGISVMDRHMARAQETLKIAEAMLVWAGQLNPEGPVYSRPSVASSASAYGLTEAPRGALGHWLNISSGKISRYMVITPTCWNASPRDTSGTPGPIEQALVNTPVENADEPVEVLRVIHSFDPCLSCAVHVMRPAKGAKVFTLVHSHGETGSHAHGHGGMQTFTHDRHLEDDDRR
jgi:hydrogenase large subunit